MTALLVLTALAGFSTSVLLLHLGLSSMAVRYPIALLSAYGAFLLLLKGWLSSRLSSHVSSQGSRLDVLSEVIDIPTSVPGRAADTAAHAFGGGRFGGGGAGASFIAPPVVAPSPSGSSLVGDAVGSSVAEAVGDSDDAWPIVLVIGLAVGILIAAGAVVYSAPALFAELLLDGLIAGGMLRRLRGVEPGHWASIAVRRTWLPVLGLALLLAAGGWAMARVVPGADSIGDVLRA